MIKWIIAVVLILAMLSVAGCCCCSSSGYDGYYSTVGGQDLAVNGQGATPYDCLSGTCDGSCVCQK